MEEVLLYYLAGSIICLTLLVTYKGGWAPPLPPGPPAEPLLGHARLIPIERQHITFYELGKVYGDVMYLRFPGRNVIVLNSMEAAADLLEKKSALYSDRVDFVLYKLMGWTKTMPFLRYGRTFKTQRRLFQDHLSAAKIPAYQHILSAETQTLLQNLLQDADQREKYIKRYATSIIVDIAYGFRIEFDDDEYLRITAGATHALSNGGPPGCTPVDLFPILKYFPSWFPGASYVKFAREHREYIENLYTYPFERVQRAMAAGIPVKPCFLSAHLEAFNHEGENYKYTLDDIKSAAGTMYAGGAQTTSGTLLIFIYLMTIYPEVQGRAQKEIDDIVGWQRLPTFEDRKSLPYVEALYQEVLRCYPVAPMGIPHVAMQDEIYRGMYIPKGSVIVANAKGICLDKNIYIEPTVFDPSRFLPMPEGKDEPFPSAVFGFGRRVCPGRHLAESSVWIVMVRVLATLKISKAVDPEGEEIRPTPVFTSGITSHPGPFPCVITARSEASRDLVGGKK